MYREDYELEDILQILIKMFVVHVMVQRRKISL